MSRCGAVVVPRMRASRAYAFRRRMTNMRHATWLRYLRHTRFEVVLWPLWYDQFYAAPYEVSAVAASD